MLPVRRRAKLQWRLAIGRGPRADIAFHNTSLYNLAELSSYPPPNTGLYEHTNRASDVGRFRAPTLRNIALTTPYMHDGSVGKLEGAIDHYSAGGRTIASGPHRGVGSANPNKSPAIDGFELSDDERADLLASLRSLTDQELLQDLRWSNPWSRAH